MRRNVFFTGIISFVLLFGFVNVGVVYAKDDAEDLAKTITKGYGKIFEAAARAMAPSKVREAASSATSTDTSRASQSKREQEALDQTFSTLSQHIPQHSRIAIITIAASDPDEGAFFLDEITLRFVNAKKYTVVDRQQMEVTLSKQNLQLADYADDASAVSIGKYFGMAVVITGSINGTGSRKRLVLKALDVRTSEILAMSSVALQE